MGEDLEMRVRLGASGICAQSHFLAQPIAPSPWLAHLKQSGDLTGEEKNLEYDTALTFSEYKNYDDLLVKQLRRWNICDLGFSTA